MAGPMPHMLHLQLEQRENVGKLVRARRRAVLFSEGEPAHSVYVLKSGLVKLTRKVPKDREVLTGIVFPGELFGERALMAEHPRDCSAVVVRESVANEVSRDDFMDLCRQFPELWQWMADLLNRRLQQVERRVQLLCQCGVRDRILHTLADLALQFDPSPPEGSGVAVPLTQQELANLVGATRETTSAALNALERRGLMQLGRRHVRVFSPEVLRAAALTGIGPL